MSEKKKNASATWLQINLKNWSWGREVKSSATDISDVQSWFSDVKDYPWKGEGIPMKRVGGEGEGTPVLSIKSVNHAFTGWWMSTRFMCYIYYNLKLGYPYFEPQAPNGQELFLLQPDTLKTLKSNWRPTEKQSQPELGNLNYLSFQAHPLEFANGIGNQMRYGGTTKRTRGMVGMGQVWRRWRKWV